MNARAASAGAAGWAWLWLVVGGCAAPPGGTSAEKRAATERMADATLADLYRERPLAQRHVEGAPGYGVFSNVQGNFLLTSAGNGYGVVYDQQLGREYHMRMAEFGLGLGVGLKDFRAVFVFNDAATLRRFVNEGWEFGAEADAAIKFGDDGAAASGASSFDTPITIYQLTENGMMVQASLSGTRYWRERKRGEE